MAQNEIIKELDELSGKLPSLIAAHAVRVADLAAQMAKLKAAGLIYASFHWREGKYFYLVYPVKAGDKRKRDYIGTDKEKIKAAQAAMARAKAYDALAVQLGQYEGFLMDSRRVLKHLVTTLASSFGNGVTWR